MTYLPPPGNRRLEPGGNWHQRRAGCPTKPCVPHLAEAVGQGQAAATGHTVLAVRRVCCLLGLTGAMVMVASPRQPHPRLKRFKS